MAAKADGWTPANTYGTISEINIQPTANSAGADVIITADFSSTPTSCTIKNKFHLDTSNKRGERLFSVLLAAHAASKEVRFYVKDKGCSMWNIPWVDGVYSR